ncbi:carbohydrate ABC transporter permease [Clostridium sp. ZS2-4]|uniref:carbohydrate ABC transporter permease n=1 Tax=Clostridium sp. ZS2-4 TaxID=2987703 RepID=UPI00227B58D7|nr:carbohydrate ABC transporter permease [Clostridium sp. ZS2-4]MCY6355908.1 carbohydrate ABC transporter permease [Clostridium sp. ZS2-4]
METNINFKTKKNSKIILNGVLKYCCAGIIVIWSLFPVYWMLNNSFKNRVEQFYQKPTFFPHDFTLENYIMLFEELGFQKNMLNSAVISISSTVIAVVIGSMAAYSISRFRFKAKKFLLVWILVTRIFPPITFVIPLYSIMGKLSLLNSRTAIILSYIVFNLPFAIWMLISFFNEVPVEIEESSMVDGATSYQTFSKIVLPLVIPDIAATAVFTFMMSWNEFMYAMIFIQSPELVTIPVSLSGLITEYLVLWGPMSAGGVLSLIPIIIFVLFMQDYLVKGLTLGAVKG